MVRFDAGHFWFRSGGPWRRLPFVLGPALVTTSMLGLYLLITAGPPVLALAGLALLLGPYIVLFVLLLWYGVRYHSEKRGL